MARILARISRQHVRSGHVRPSRQPDLDGGLRPGVEDGRDGPELRAGDLRTIGKANRGATRRLRAAGKAKELRRSTPQTTPPASQNRSAQGRSRLSIKPFQIGGHAARAQSRSAVIGGYSTHPHRSPRLNDRHLAGNSTGPDVDQGLLQVRRRAAVGRFGTVRDCSCRVMPVGGAK